MFSDLEPLDCAEDLIFALGRSGGMLDPRTDVRGVGDTAHGAAGWPFFGQFIYGHAQIRDTYVVREGAPAVPIFPDLIGFRPIPAELVVDWSYLFDLHGRTARQHAKRIDARLAASLIDLPLQITGAVDVAEYHSLAVRDLERGNALGLPSGEAIARAMNVEPLTTEQTGLRKLGWELGTPLWFYILKEAEIDEGGERLGPVGGRICSEVLLGIVDADPESYRSVDRDWRPSLPHHGAVFGLGGLLAFAQEVRDVEAAAA